MSVLNVLIDKLDNCNKKFDELLILKKNNSAELNEKEREIEDIFTEVEKNTPKDLLNFIERMHTSSENDEHDILIDFKSLENDKRHMLLKMMELIWKMGLFEDATDVDKRERWYDLLKAHLNYY
jgi:hypothetical protein